MVTSISANAAGNIVGGLSAELMCSRLSRMFYEAPERGTVYSWEIELTLLQMLRLATNPSLTLSYLLQLSMRCNVEAYGLKWAGH
ncbi:hypothetical protein N656DRAFT_144014 [Canariomyces notabilis]|uniref:Uncharacterized protein n=1 Tax=Canariomyces notabilis TaxID=2074819 RepID=A0AAN6YQE7_9PEZI|nr:hypothetical protein N656DRAFT_144014 [Canariomyces arenarius]